MDILEHNLYGVDINEESVEIAQLALWLRTAKKHRKLNTLSGNIKCGNSLISPNDDNISPTNNKGASPLATQPHDNTPPTDNKGASPLATQPHDDTPTTNNKGARPLVVAARLWNE